MNEQSEETLRDEAAKCSSLIVIHADNGVLVGVIPVQWGQTVLSNSFLAGLLDKYHLLHITDAASIYKYLRAWNRA